MPPRLFALGAAVALSLSGCTTADNAALTELRDTFVASGGVCDSWTAFDEPRSQGAIECDSGAKLYVFDSDASERDLVKTELDTNTDIRARTHIMLSGETWLVIDRIAVIVHVFPSMGGIIQGRNGANP